jgi:hypothetical protein
MSEIRPALTREEWAGATGAIDPLMEPFTELHVSIQPDGALAIWGAYDGGVQSPAARHALAALALHGQPFGFTWQDVDLLRDAVDYLDPRIRTLADRIAALLPPREE